ncbi:ragB/SusD family protein [Bacillus thuringiensis serovar tolworthi]|uniref:RagB/SusD family protein n=1 Tax=Bacillus thuringiensis subsp. tolworthi TaxID=1442 RepID=A0A9W4EWR7_BACTO|nr:ragB/SusD family protein [Bacillus thuringiensis serovar tolworthi]
MIQKIEIDRVSDATWEFKNQFVSKNNINNGEMQYETREIWKGSYWNVNSWNVIVSRDSI